MKANGVLHPARSYEDRSYPKTVKRRVGCELARASSVESASELAICSNREPSFRMASSSYERERVDFSANGDT